MTTHYMDEAENCNRIAIIDHGKIIALNTPEGLKIDLGGDTIQITTENVSKAEKEIKLLNLHPKITNNNISFQVQNGNEFLPNLGVEILFGYPNFFNFCIGRKSLVNEAAAF